MDLEEELRKEFEGLDEGEEERRSTPDHRPGQARSGRAEGEEAPRPPQEWRRGKGKKGKLRLREDGFTPARQKKFLKVLAKTGCVKDAAGSVGLSTTSIYRARDRMPDFAARMETARQMASVELEAIAWKRAVEGVEEKVIREGVVVRTRIKPSDSILRTLLQGSNPKKYGAGGGRITPEMEARMRAKIEKELREKIEEEVFYISQERRDEALASIRRKLDAIRRKDLREGCIEDEHGRIIPPGWVREDGSGRTARPA